MSIVKMKRLRLIGMRDQREELLRLLQHMGCVEVSEPEDFSHPAGPGPADPGQGGQSQRRGGAENPGQIRAQGKKLPAGHDSAPAGGDRGPAL